jgi:hypothetical protein
VLQLVQNKLRHKKRAFQKSGFAKIGHPSIDDDTGVQYFQTCVSVRNVGLPPGHTGKFLLPESRP